MSRESEDMIVSAYQEFESLEHKRWRRTIPYSVLLLGNFGAAVAALNGVDLAGQVFTFPYWIVDAVVVGISAVPVFRTEKYTARMQTLAIDIAKLEGREPLEPTQEERLARRILLASNLISPNRSKTSLINTVSYFSPKLPSEPDIQQEYFEMAEKNCIRLAAEVHDVKRYIRHLKSVLGITKGKWETYRSSKETLSYQNRYASLMVGKINNRLTQLSII